MPLTVQPLEISDCLLVTPDRFRDDRGFFSETYNKAALKDAGLDIDFVQDNQSLSRPKGTVRGLHFQNPAIRPGQTGTGHQGRRARCRRRYPRGLADLR